MKSHSVYAPAPAPPPGTAKHTHRTPPPSPPVPPRSPQTYAKAKQTYVTRGPSAEVSGPSRHALRGPVQGQGAGGVGGVKLNKEDYFLFADFMQEQCNRSLVLPDLQGELGRREEEREELRGAEAWDRKSGEPQLNVQTLPSFLPSVRPPGVPLTQPATLAGAISLGRAGWGHLLLPRGSTPVPPPPSPVPTPSPPGPCRHQGSAHLFIFL